jgi:hypothetical protein
LEDPVRRLYEWIIVCSLGVPVALACSGKKGGPVFDETDGGGSSGDDGGSSSGFSFGGSSGNYNFQNNGGDSGSAGPCKGGHYSGDFTGSYTSHLTGVGVPIPVAGNVELDLHQEGSPGMMCTLNGETEMCSNVFSLQNGTITGVADAIWVNDAAVGGFPYFCVMTGTLDCAKKTLVNGWIQCTYCVGPLGDGGTSCATSVGGNFAGPLTAGYDYATLAFVNGTWNGAEALAGNNGMMPGPDGGSVYNYLSDSGLYLGPGDFGGSGTWNAKLGP